MSKGRKRIEIDVRDTSKLYYGQKVYVVELNPYGTTKTITEKCPVCEDTKKIEVKGYKLRCPLCEGGSVVDATVSRLYDYIVCEYIINKFEVTGSESKNAYTGDGAFSERNLPYVKWYGFSKLGNGYSGVRSRRFYEEEFREIDPEKVDMKRGADTHCFFSKADAKLFCKRLHERQKDLLDKFNAEHGMDHQYPFEY